jgi:outer membrane protein insertion porin family
MARWWLLVLCGCCLAGKSLAQTAIDAPPVGEHAQKQKAAAAKAQEKTAQAALQIQFVGERAFSEKELRSQVKEQLTTISELGLTSARADDLAFFLELFYRKHGYSKVSVHYAIEGGGRLRLDINEGPLQTLRNIAFEGNAHEPTPKLFEYVVGPTRERYSKLQHTLPFVATDISEGVDLLQRFYISDGFLQVRIDPPQFAFHDDINQVDVTISVHEGRQYFFGDISFGGNKVYDAETLRGQIEDLLKRPYTEARLDDIPRRLQAYYKARGYYEAKVEANGNPAAAANDRVPVRVVISPGQIYHFSDVIVHGLNRLHPTYVSRRFTQLSGQPYSPDVLDDKYRALMRSGLFNMLKLEPTPIENEDKLLLDISAEEAKSKEVGFSLGYGTYEGIIVGAQFRERDLFGTGRPLTTSVEVSQRSYKGEVTYEDPYLFDSLTDFELDFKNRVYALTFDYDGYSKFELGDRVELSHHFTKQYEMGLVFSARHVDITSASIADRFLGPMSYFVDSIGYTQTLDLRQNALVDPRGFIANHTLDVATRGLGSDIQLVRTTARLAYFLPFQPKPLAPGVAPDESGTPLQRWFQQSSIAFGARAGLVHSLNHSGPDEPTTIPIDERFFNGGASTVRSFGERELGPHDPKGNPLGGEFYTVFNVEYTFPIYGELQGAVFFDAGDLLPTSEEPGVDDMRYAIGAGLRYKLPIGPIRLDYGVNPNPARHEDGGAFHFSFGFAF